MNKITIIGSGRVGSTIAYTLVCRNLASEINIIDLNTDKAFGEAMDIRQGLPFTATCNIYAGSYENATDSDIIIITSGISRKPGQSRHDLTKQNFEIQRSIIPNITKYAPNAIYIIVSNPVDVLTYSFCKLSNIPHNRIIGSGTILDTSRLRSRLSECCGIDSENIIAYVFGEHGDSQFIPWSLANIAGVPIYDYSESLTNDLNHIPFNIDDVTDYVKTSGAQVISKKGATYYAASSAVCRIVEAIVNDNNTVLPVSTMMNGEYGVNDVCLSTLNIIGKTGIVAKLVAHLTDKEKKQLQNSAYTLKSAIARLELD